MQLRHKKLPLRCIARSPFGGSRPNVTTIRLYRCAESHEGGGLQVPGSWIGPSSAVDYLVTAHPGLQRIPSHPARDPPFGGSCKKREITISTLGKTTTAFARF